MDHLAIVIAITARHHVRAELSSGELHSDLTGTVTNYHCLAMTLTDLRIKPHSPGWTTVHCDECNAIQKHSEAIRRMNVTFRSC